MMQGPSGIREVAGKDAIIIVDFGRLHMIYSRSVKSESFECRHVRPGRSLGVGAEAGPCDARPGDVAVRMGLHHRGAEVAVLRCRSVKSKFEAPRV